MEKILIIRLSSIGDIVLTTPVIRTLKKQGNYTVHFILKKQYEELLRHNPFVDKLILFEGNLKQTLQELKKENYDLILDLHNNLRSYIIKRYLQVPSYTFRKENIKKFLITKFKIRLKIKHVVERYGEVLTPLGLSLDSRGLDFFIPENVIEKIVFGVKFRRYNAVVLSATYKTKKWLPEYFSQLINKIGLPVVLLGGKTEIPDAEKVIKNLQVPYINAVGKASLLESAAYMKFSFVIITHDTGMMHIASALKKPLLTIWGNTSPLYGMYPYKTKHIIAENNQIKCRPCSKLGYNECPKKHFKCITDLTPEFVYQKYKILTTSRLQEPPALA